MGVLGVVQSPRPFISILPPRMLPNTLLTELVSLIEK